MEKTFKTLVVGFRGGHPMVTNFKTRLQLRLLHLIEKSYILLIIKKISKIGIFDRLVDFSTCYVSYHWIVSKYILKVFLTPISNSI